MAQDTEEFISVSEAAQILRVSSTTVRNWAAEGKLGAQHMVKGRRVFSRSIVYDLASKMLPNDKPLLLVIDDDADIRFILKEAFVSVGFEVVEAESGLLGLDAVDQRTPSIVLLDIMMPGIDGFQMMKHLTQFGIKVPVIIMSALGDRAEAKAEELGADLFVAKPFDIRDLVIKVRKLVSQYESASKDS